MEIKNINQYNQGIGKYKLLSSNSGVGSIVATKWGGFIMPLTSTYWDFVNDISKYLEENPNDVIDYHTLSVEKGVEFIEDNRFVDFLQKTEHLTNLRCLVAIPHVTLSQSNYCDVKEHPLNVRYKEKHTNIDGNLKEGLFTVPAIVFPRWFYSKSNRRDFKPIEDWLRIWRRQGCNNGEEKYFAPPRDPYLKTNRIIKDNNLPEGKNRMHALLEQVSMVLICPNGHISDIPWQKYFCAKCNDKDKKLTEKGFDLFNYDESLCPCSDGGQHELQWLENRNHAESYGTLWCKKCGKRVSLEGIMNIQPLCPGERPWEGIGSHESTACVQNGQRCTMKWALVTSNSVYFAENFSSLFIPDCYLKKTDILSDKQKHVLVLMRDRWFVNYKKNHPEATEQSYVESKSIDEFVEKAFESGHELANEDMEKIVKAFVPCEDNAEVSDIREDYRFTEFSVFNNNSQSLEESDKLRFKDIELPEVLKPYFQKIQQVSTLGLSCTQINFSRVQMPQPRIVNGNIEYPNSMKIFKGQPDEVRVMPANQTFGEGLFFSFDESRIASWLKENTEQLKSQYKADSKHESMYDNLYEKMRRGGFAKFYLLHTFSHVLMKELEFSCGYPTASLSERLYFSDRMCGVLIYTADGSEGSMGGLVWQGQPTLISRIISSALRRAMNCASDPICWENEDQLNRAACFSCAMVSETSCEERNLGLDRRCLVDENFGFFRELI